jgi:Domain of unknown function (DUF4386)
MSGPREDKSEMKANTNAARVIGVLFLVATASYLVGTQLIDSVVRVPDYLARAHPDRARLVAGALLVLVDAAAVVGIAVTVFPILRRQNESVALGYVGFRIIEAALLVVGVLGPLSLITLSREYLAAGTAAASHFATVGAMAAKANYWPYQLAMVLLGCCGLMFCWLLNQSRLVPRWLAVLGLVGYPLLSIGAVLDMIGEVDTLHGTGMLFVVPGGLFELVLPLWLLAVGFASSGAITPEGRVLEARG